MLFADVVLNVVEFFFAGLVVIDQFPRSESDGTVQADARTSVAPNVGVVPNERTMLRRVTTFRQQWHKATPVNGLRHFVLPHSTHFQKGGEVVFDDEVAIATRLRTHFARPAHNHRFANATLQQRSFAGTQWGVLRVERFVAVVAARGIAAIVAHENDHRILSFAIAVEPVEQFAKAVIHSLNERGIGGLLR